MMATLAQKLNLMPNSPGYAVLRWKEGQPFQPMNVVACSSNAKNEPMFLHHSVACYKCQNATGCHTHDAVVLAQNPNLRPNSPGLKVVLRWKEGRPL